MLKSRKHFASLAGLAALLLFGFSQAGATNIAACGTFGSGSYVLVNNISSVNVLCIQFSSGPATLDLKGFTISGSGTHHGVYANGAVANVTVRNGTIKGFSRSIGLTGAGTVIDGVNALTGSQNGISVGNNATVRNCQVTGHTGGGILAGKNATIVGNTLSGNSGNMITVSDGSIVKGNIVTNNSGVSVAAIRVSNNCKVVDNVVANSSFGVTATGSHNVISGNNISNSVEGIHGCDTCVVTGNNSSDNSDNGLEAGLDGVISGNNLSNNQNVGVTADVRTLFLNNVANDNGNAGINVTPGSAAIANVADSNSSSGLAAALGCPSKIDNNTALLNGTPNISSDVGCVLSNNLAP
jgi:parallel beta-helix repeat protein